MSFFYLINVVFEFFVIKLIDDLNNNGKEV